MKRLLGRNIGIDLGTTSVIIYTQGKGVVLDEPSAVAYKTQTRRLCAVGQKAFDMLERSPDSLRVVQPMRDGVVSDFTATRQMLTRYLTKVCSNSIFKPNVVVCMPSGVTNLEKRTVLDIVTAAGAGRACLMEEPLAAALGAGVDTAAATGTLVVDIGGGAMLLRMSDAIRNKTGIKTRLAENPRTCVARGIGKALGNLELLVEQGYIFKNREEITGFYET